MGEKDLPLKRVVRRDEVPEAGLAVALRTDHDTRAAIARLMDIPAVEELSADLDVALWRRNGLAVRGQLNARVVQTCVVTLEPVHNAVDVRIEEFYSASPDAASGWEGADATAPLREDIEPLVDDRIDVGALVVEHLALGLDPYPRCPGVEFEAPGDADAGSPEETGPFAALADWQDRRKDD